MDYETQSRLKMLEQRIAALADRLEEATKPRETGAVIDLKEKARRHNLKYETARRNAEKLGGTKPCGRWVFPA
jgi:hypothetical protein